MAARSVMNLTFHADFASVDQARSALLGACREVFPLESEAVSDLCMAANEAMNNAVEHSGSSQVEIELRIDDNCMIFRISTCGERFDPTAGNAVMPECDEQGELREGGYGLALIQVLIDSMSYEYLEGKNILTLVRKVKGGVNDGN